MSNFLKRRTPLHANQLTLTIRSWLYQLIVTRLVKKLQEANNCSLKILLHIFRAIFFYTQVFRQLIAQLVLILLLVSAEDHRHLQGAA